MAGGKVGRRSERSDRTVPERDNLEGRGRWLRLRGEAKWYC